MSSPHLESWRRWIPAALVLLSVVLLVTVVSLTRDLIDEARGDEVDVLEAGQQLDLVREPYGVAHTVIMPTTETVITVGRPLQSLGAGWFADSSEHDVVAADGTTLVPVSWYFGPQSDVIEDPHRTRISLTAGEQEVEVASVYLGERADGSYRTSQPSVIAMPGDVDLEDLRVEVEYDGLTQVLDPATGDIDAGVAQPLYEPERQVPSGCTSIDDNCMFAPTDPEQALHPEGSQFTVTDMLLVPYFRGRGWAEEGRLWALVDFRSYVGDVVDAAGHVRVARRQAGPRVTLDGGRPLNGARFRASTVGTGGLVVFSVPVDAERAVLRLRTRFFVGGGVGVPVTGTVRFDLAD